MPPLHSLRKHDTSVDGQAARPAPASRPAPAAGPEPDRRLWCTTPRSLSLIVGELLDRGHRSADVHSLAQGLREAQSYPARDFAQHCLPRRPDLFVTYNWDENFVDLQEAIHSGMRGIASMIHANRPELERERIDRLCLDGIGIWIDFLFIDQNARDVLAEVNTVVPQAIDAADGSEPRLVLLRARVVSSPGGGGRREPDVAQLRRADRNRPLPRFQLREDHQSRGQARA